jgi:hypothetical protein
MYQSEINRLGKNRFLTPFTNLSNLLKNSTKDERMDDYHERRLKPPLEARCVLT